MFKYREILFNDSIHILVSSFIQYIVRTKSIIIILVNLNDELFDQNWSIYLHFFLSMRSLFQIQVFFLSDTCSLCNHNMTLIRDKE